MKTPLFPALAVLILTACSVGQRLDVDLKDTNKPRSSSSQSSMEEKSYPPLSQLDKQKVTAFLGVHINEYVTTPPSVLDGKFYITDVNWYTDNTAIVTYEDDVQTVRARVTATVDGNEVRIVSFNEFSVE